MSDVTEVVGIDSLSRVCVVNQCHLTIVRHISTLEFPMYLSIPVTSTDCRVSVCILIACNIIYIIPTRIVGIPQLTRPAARYNSMFMLSCVMKVAHGNATKPDPGGTVWNHTSSCMQKYARARVECVVQKSHSTGQRKQK